MTITVDLLQVGILTAIVLGAVHVEHRLTKMESKIELMLDAMGLTTTTAAQNNKAETS